MCVWSLYFVGCRLLILYLFLLPVLVTYLDHDGRHLSKPNEPFGTTSYHLVAAQAAPPCLCYPLAVAILSVCFHRSHLVYGLRILCNMTRCVCKCILLQFNVYLPRSRICILYRRNLSRYTFDRGLEVGIILYRTAYFTSSIMKNIPKI